MLPAAPCCCLHSSSSSSSFSLARSPLRLPGSADIVSVSDQRQYDAYEKLKEANINVYAVKTDAFHIAKMELKKAKKILNFHNDKGG